MPTTEQEEQWQRADDEVQKNLPPGVKLLRTLRGHTYWIGRIAWSPDGRLLASPSGDRTVRIWNAESSNCESVIGPYYSGIYGLAWSNKEQVLLFGDDDGGIFAHDLGSKRTRVFKGSHGGRVESLACSPVAEIVASASADSRVSRWAISTGECVHIFKGHTNWVNTVSWSPDGSRIASGDESNRVIVWDVATGSVVFQLDGHKGWVVDVDWSGSGEFIVTASNDRTIRVWNARTGILFRTLEGHVDGLRCVEFSPDSRLLASRAQDNTIRFWCCNTWQNIATINERTFYGVGPTAGLAFHPKLPLFAAVGTDFAAAADTVIRIFELDSRVLLADGKPGRHSIAYTTSKIVLLGDSGVGKTGLGWRLAHGEFKEHSSTHGQQFWLLDQLCKERADGTECEAVLWDLAGQPDYRLIHALFLDDADLALVLFDPTRNDDPLGGVEFWLKQLKVGHPAGGGPPAVLISARSDRGTPRLTQEEMDAFCCQRGITAYHITSAKAGEGIKALVERMKALIPWDTKPATVTTETFKRIKVYVLELKHVLDRGAVILTPEELRARLQASDRAWQFTVEEMLTAIGHLANHGYVTRLKTSLGEPRFLLAPELLNNLAASFVLEARREEKGLGSLKEEKLLAGGYAFPELEKVTPDERAILLDSAAALFLEHNVCFRETDLLGNAYLVFPELINLKRPIEDNGQSVEDGVAYTASGAVENVYASLVVLMGYTQTFTRTNQWRNHARYEVGRGQVCGFRLEAERAGELDFVLYFAKDTPAPVRMLFQSLFENFLNRRNLTVHRFEPVVCKNGHVVNRAVVREQLSLGAESTFCNRCGKETPLPKADQPIQLTKLQTDEVNADRRAADERSRFEQMLFRLKTYVTEYKLAVPECFISYAWGVPEHELWVERRLATDLQKAGVSVVLDRWENARIGASVPRFVEKAGKCDRVIVVGTPLYRKKYDNDEPMRSFVVAAEGDLIGKRMIGTEAKKESVLPLLLDGTEETSFPHLLHGRVYGNFSKSEAYFTTILDLLLSVFAIGPQEPVAVDLRASLTDHRLLTV